MYNIVKRYYNQRKTNGERIYSKEDVAKFVVAGKITAEEYKKITDEDYVE